MKCPRRVLVAASLLWLAPFAAHAQQTDDAILERCITRDSATAWLRTRAEWSTERAGSWTNDSLRNVLIALALADQAVRPATGLMDSLRSFEFVLRMTRQDSIGRMAMQEIVRRFGWPTRSMVGVRGSAAAFMMAQHNVGFQEEALRHMRALPSHEVQLADVATLEDRFRASRNEPQRYGTQLRPDDGGLLQFHPIDSLARLGERRAAAGLPPMPVYLCMIRAQSRREVKYPPDEVLGPRSELRFRRYWSPHARVHVGSPQLASVSLGAMYVMWRSSDLNTSSGLLILAEPGVRAGKIRFGYGSIGSSGLGVSGTVSLLNNWREGPWLQPWPVYTGVEIHVTGRRLDFGAGQYQSLKHGKIRFAVSLGMGI